MGRGGRAGTVAQGEDILVTDGDHVIARITAPPAPPAPRQVRQPGLMEGQIRMSEDFDAPLPDDIRKAFE
jgi:antitoxin (DNA-binding transcriptional repressor) of toxin-antitoxin stability system